MPTKFLKMPLELGQDLINYLQEKPHKEVYIMINALMSLEQIENAAEIKYVKEEIMQKKSDKEFIAPNFEETEDM